jgi:hypothetical protein
VDAAATCAEHAFHDADATLAIDDDAVVAHDDGAAHPLLYSVSMFNANTPCEDAESCIYDPDLGMTVLSVFDGHGGGSVATFAARQLPALILQQLQQLHHAKQLRPDSATARVQELLQRCFLQCDELVMHAVRCGMRGGGAADAAAAAGLPPITSNAGCCALVVLLWHSRGQIYVASVGDCRAVLGVTNQPTDRPKRKRRGAAGNVTMSCGALLHCVRASVCTLPLTRSSLLCMLCVGSSVGKAQACARIRGGVAAVGGSDVQQPGGGAARARAVQRPQPDPPLRGVEPAPNPAGVHDATAAAAASDAVRLLLAALTVCVCMCVYACCCCRSMETATRTSAVSEAASWSRGHWATRTSSL